MRRYPILLVELVLAKSVQVDVPKIQLTVDVDVLAQPWTMVNVAAQALASAR